QGDDRARALSVRGIGRDHLPGALEQRVVAEERSGSRQDLARAAEVAREAMAAPNNLQTNLTPGDAAVVDALRSVSQQKEPPPAGIPGQALDHTQLGRREVLGLVHDYVVVAFEGIVPLQLP